MPYKSIWVQLGEFIQAHPDEFTMYIGIIILGIIVYYYIFCYLHPRVFMQKPGVWRIKRHIGYMKSIPKSLSMKSGSIEQSVKVILYRHWYPPYSNFMKVIMHRGEIIEKGGNYIIVNRKYFYWNKELESFQFSDEPQRTYVLNTTGVQKGIAKKVRSIDAKCSQGARASPTLIRQNLLQHSIPMDPMTYDEAGKVEVGEPDGVDFAVDNDPPAGEYMNVMTPTERDLAKEDAKQRKKESDEE